MLCTLGQYYNCLLFLETFHKLCVAQLTFAAVNSHLHDMTL